MPEKFKTWYECIEPKEGTTHENETKCNIQAEEEVNINRMIEKYGITALAQRTKPEEELYIDTTMYGEMTVQDAIKNKKEIENYYNNLPSIIRKSFGDNYETFYGRLKNGEFEQFIEKNILSKDTVNNIRQYIKNKEEQTKQQIINNYKMQELAKIEAKKELGGTENEN